MNWLNKLERKYGRYAIGNLMKYIVIGNAIVFGMEMIGTTSVIADKLAFNAYAILRGEVWRLFTFIFYPPNWSPIFILFALYFYYMIGTALEHEWGSFKFNIYYLIGMLGTILAGFITGGYITSTYLNLSLFLAFAYLYPDFQILLFFILPVKIKYLAYINWAYIVWAVITEPLPLKVAAIVSVINYFVFFGKDMISGMGMRKKVHSNRRKFKSQIPVNRTIHRCTVCGITEKDDPNMEFRYCSKCDGAKCYCMNHIRNHEHIVIPPEEKIIEFKPRDRE